MADINFSEMNQKMRQARTAQKKNPSRMSAKQPARSPKTKPGIAKLSKVVKAVTKSPLAKVGARVISKAAAPVAVAVTAYETGKAIHEGVKAYKAKKHLSRTKAHTQKHYTTPAIAAATRKRKTGK